MPFDFYYRLSPAKRVIYRKSDEIAEVPLSEASGLSGAVAELREALADGGRAATASAAATLADGVLERLCAPPVRVRVLSARPADSRGELHGLYEWEEGQVPLLTVWMRTAARGQVVAFRTFLRTLLHELCHHLDFEHHGFAESFHTQGFLRRESSLMRQLAPAGSQPAMPGKPARRPPSPAQRSKRPARRPPARTPESPPATRREKGRPAASADAQLELPW